MPIGDDKFQALLVQNTWRFRFDGHGFSVFDVVDTVKRVSGVGFEAEIAPRRDGDPAQIVADSTRARETLAWQPRFDDLSTIVSHALAWERELMKRRANAADPAGKSSKKPAAAASSKRSS